MSQPPPSQHPPQPARKLSYNSVDDVVNDIARLRGGYKQHGNWTLAQTCWHLDTALRSRMVPGPFPPNTPEQDARRERLSEIISTGRLPSGIEAPAPFVPSANVDDSVIDKFIATLWEYDTYPGDYAPHRIFGNLSKVDAKKMNLIHCAHHLAHLVPTSEGGSSQ